jgi:predicted RNA methylase
MHQKLDQFYTNPSVARECLEDIVQEIGPLADWSLIVEPSAGSGSFLNLLPRGTIAIDLDPSASEIIRADYLTWEPLTPPRDCLVVGNPPFGKNSSLAIEFFNRSARFADTIAFILPRTFRKASVINRLHKGFHLVHERILPLDSFHTPQGTPRAVPTCFQIWRRAEHPREPRTKGPCTHPDWSWLESPIGATHAIRRVGVAAGKLIQNQIGISPASHFFIEAHIPHLDAVWKDVWEVCWRQEGALNAKWDVAGNPSLTKEEIVFYYTQVTRINS